VSAVSLRHVGIPVSDMKRSLAFYADLLGFREVADFPSCSGQYYETLTAEPGVHIHIKYLELAGGERLELLAYARAGAGPGPARSRDVGRWHVSLTIRGLEALVARAGAMGVGFLSAPQRSPDGKVDVCFCRDPDGNLIELVEERAGAERAEKKAQ
jgi:catechol 2,3-dioxygenase-like lactoylglutathione lyase family enzyme